MSKRIRPGLAAILLLGLASCSAPPALNPSFGEAVRRNMQQHIIDPDPVYAEEETLTSGPRAAGAIDRYEKGRVTPIVVPRTTTIGSGGMGARPQ
ncbi:MAG: hypothetical protein KIT20_07165 [Alphaproteobacteria bacterium]|nr:hypothetical protein [Alphaproteobacteria bacterium]